MKVKKTAKTTIKKKNKKAKKSEEPIVKVLNLNVNPENPRNGFFELDWNDEFVNMLKQSGYLGASDEEIVDRWFQTLCRTIGNGHLPDAHPSRAPSHPRPTHFHSALNLPR